MSLNGARKASRTAGTGRAETQERTGEAKSIRETFARYPSTIKVPELEGIARKFHFPRGCRAMSPTLRKHAGCPPSGFITVNTQHLEHGLRFSVPSYIIKFLNVV